MNYNDIEYVVEQHDMELIESYLHVQIEKILERNPDWTSIAWIVEDGVMDTHFIKPELFTMNGYGLEKTDHESYLIFIDASYIDTIAVDDPAGKFAKVEVTIGFDGEVGVEERTLSGEVDVSIETLI